MVARHFCNESILRDCGKTPVSFFWCDTHALCFIWCDTHALCFMQYVCFIWCDTHALCFMQYVYFMLHAIRLFHALCDTHALCFMQYACFMLYAIRLFHTLCDTPVSCFMRKVCSMRRAWLWGIYRMFCFCEELSKSTIYWLDQSTVIDYPTICFALTHRIYHLCSSSNHLSPAT